MRLGSLYGAHLTFAWRQGLSFSGLGYHAFAYRNLRDGKFYVGIRKAVRCSKCRRPAYVYECRDGTTTHFDTKLCVS